MLNEIATLVAADLLAGSTMEAIKSLVMATESRGSIKHTVALASVPELKQLRTWFIEELKVVPGEENIVADGVKRYLLSPEVITAIEHIFAFELADQLYTYKDELMQEIAIGLSHYGIDSTEISSELFIALANVVSLAIENSYPEGAGPLTEQTKSLVQAMTTNVLLQAMHTQLSLLISSSSEVSQAQVSTFMDSYRAAAAPIYSKIQPPSLEGAEPVNIEQIYVAPTLSTESRELSIDQLVRLSRAVVLGDPGGGKTSLTTKIAHDLLKANDSSLTRGSCSTVPFIIVLREFAAEWKVRPQSLVEYMASVLKSKFQIQTTTQLIEWLLVSGQALVVFDGLDELLDTTLRTQIRNIIQSFESLYTNAHIVVTSRLVGYDMAPLPSSTFPKVTLGPFSEDNIEIYVRKWFELSAGLGTDELEAIATKFLTESAIAADIRTNPLMLGLMCTIYRSEGYIPRNRPTLYEKCSRLLFDTWDRRRDLLQPVEYEAHIETALMYIAYWIFEDEARRSGVSERVLIQKAADYLEAKQYGEREPAELAARNFIRFCRGRGWVFTEVGLDEHDERLYRFTHQTFLEYFTAAHLSRIYDLDSLIALIVERAAKAEWDVVAQLSLQIKTRAIEGGPDYAVSIILAEMRSRDVEQARELAGFLCRCTAFLALTPKTVDQMIDVVWDVYITWVTSESDSDKPGNDSPTSSAWTSLIAPLVRSAREIKGRIASRLATRISAELAVATDLRLEITAAVAVQISGSRRQGANDDSRWDEQFDELGNELLPVLSDHQALWRWALLFLLYESPSFLNTDLLTMQVVFSEVELTGVPFKYFSPAYAVCRVLITQSCSTALMDVPLVTSLLIDALGRVSLDQTIESSIELAYLFGLGTLYKKGCQHAAYSNEVLLDVAKLMCGVIELPIRGNRLRTVQRSFKTALDRLEGLGHLEFMRSAITRHLDIVDDTTLPSEGISEPKAEWLEKWANRELSILPASVRVSFDMNEMYFGDEFEGIAASGDEGNRDVAAVR